MARGRRPDTSLKPSRQLLTQRAFRQRRAAHLAELEEKVKKLEKENAALKGVEYSEDATSSKRVKREGRDTTSTDSNLYSSSIQDDENEDGQCDRCLSHESNRADIMNAAAAVDKCMMSLFDSMHILRQTLYRQAGETDKATPPNTIPTPSPSYSRPVVGPGGRHAGQRHSMSYSAHGSAQTPAFLDMSIAQRINVNSLDAVSPSTVKGFSIPHPSQPGALSTVTPMESRPGVMKKNSTSMPMSPYARPPSGSSFSHSTLEAASTSMRTTRENSTTAASSSSSVGPAAYSSVGGSGSTPRKEIILPTSHDKNESHTSLNQTVEVRPLLMGNTPQRLLERQQWDRHQPSAQQSQAHQQQSSSAAMPPHNYHQSFPAIPYSFSREEMDGTHGRIASQNSSVNLSQVGADENKCCLGFFECDSQGNLVIPS